MIVLSLAVEPFNGQPMAPLTWDVCLWGSDAIKTALVTCGNGHTGSVNPYIHKIAADGTLSPSWVCPFEGCSWHEFTRLEGWGTAP